MKVNCLNPILHDMGIAIWVWVSIVRSPLCTICLFVWIFLAIVQYMEQDMGISFWEGTPGKVTPPFQPTPLPLLNQTTIVEQPVDLSTLNQKYTDKVVSWIQQEAAAENPFYVYFSFNHVHGPNSCNPKFCGKYVDAMPQQTQHNLLMYCRTGGTRDDDRSS